MIILFMGLLCSRKDPAKHKDEPRLIMVYITNFTFADANVGSEQSTLRQLGNRRENLAPSGQLSLSFVHLSRTVLKSWKSEQHSCAKPSVYIIAP